MQKTIIVDDEAAAVPTTAPNEQPKQGKAVSRKAAKSAKRINHGKNIPA